MIRKFTDLPEIAVVFDRVLCWEEENFSQSVIATFAQ